MHIYIYIYTHIDIIHYILIITVRIKQTITTIASARASPGPESPWVAPKTGAAQGSGGSNYTIPE